MTPTQECIPNIDVKETLAAAVASPKCIYTILESIRQEKENVPIEVPPEDSFDLMLYVAQNREDIYFLFVDKREYTPEKLLPFIKMSTDIQKKILYRCFFVYWLYFKFGGVSMPEFPLKFQNQSL